MCCNENIRGPQGIQGETGPMPTYTRYAINNTNISAQTDITVFASASATGQVVYTGVIEIDSNADVIASITPVVNGSAVSASVISVTGNSKGGVCSIAIPITEMLSITAGQSFVLRITLDTYAAASVAMGRVLYYIQ